MTVPESIQAFLATLRRRGRAPNTIDTYQYGLRSLTAHLAASGCLEVGQMTRRHLEEWQDLLLLRDLAPKSRDVACTGVRAWLKWLSQDDLVPGSLLRAVEQVRVPRRLPRPIPPVDLARIQAYLWPRRPDATERALRDRALFTLLLVTGARISEALSVRRADIGLDRPVIVTQKGGGEKELLVTPTVYVRLVDYLGVRTDDLPDLWVTAESGPRHALGRRQVQPIWAELSKAVGVPSWTSHRVRHTCATEMARLGLPALVIADHLGHANLETLPNYAAVAGAQREHAAAVLERLLTGGLDKSRSDGSRFQRPVRVGGRPDRRAAKPSSTRQEW